MKVKVNEKEYHGLLALLISIPVLSVIGVAFLMFGVLFMAIGALMTSPVWIPLKLMGWLP